MKNDVIEIQDENTNDYFEIRKYVDTVSENNSETKLLSITDFYFSEIMEGNRKLGFHRNGYEVIELFGEPLEIRIIPVSFYFSGGTVKEKHEYVYNDFIHYYYIFEDGILFYNGFTIEKRLARLKTINIGDTSEKLISTFGGEFFAWKEYENISYYTDPVICEIQFVIKDTIIQKIYVNFILI